MKASKAGDRQKEGINREFIFLGFIVMMMAGVMITYKEMAIDILNGGFERKALNEIGGMRGKFYNF